MTPPRAAAIAAARSSGAWQRSSAAHAARGDRGAAIAMDAGAPCSGPRRDRLEGAAAPGTRRTGHKGMVAVVQREADRSQVALAEADGQQPGAFAEAREQVARSTEADDGRTSIEPGAPALAGVIDRMRSTVLARAATRPTCTTNPVAASMARPGPNEGRAAAWNARQRW